MSALLESDNSRSSVLDKAAPVADESGEICVGRSSHAPARPSSLSQVCHSQRRRAARAEGLELPLEWGKPHYASRRHRRPTSDEAAKRISLIDLGLWRRGFVLFFVGARLISDTGRALRSIRHPRGQVLLDKRRRRSRKSLSPELKSATIKAFARVINAPFESQQRIRSV